MQINKIFEFVEKYLHFINQTQLKWWVHEVDIKWKIGIWLTVSITLTLIKINLGVVCNQWNIFNHNLRTSPQGSNLLCISYLNTTIFQK